MLSIAAKISAGRIGKDDILKTALVTGSSSKMPCAGLIFLDKFVAMVVKNLLRLFAMVKGSVTSTSLIKISLMIFEGFFLHSTSLTMDQDF
jgi:hypothetical protein